jgi:hypothetical protein
MPLCTESLTGYSDPMNRFLRRMKDRRLQWFASRFGKGLASAAEMYSACEYQNRSSSLKDKQSDQKRIVEDLKSGHGPRVWRGIRERFTAGRLGLKPRKRKS